MTGALSNPEQFPVMIHKLKITGNCGRDLQILKIQYHGFSLFIIDFVQIKFYLNSWCPFQCSDFIYFFWAYI